MNGAPAPGGFIKAYVSKSSEKLFFNNHEDLKTYINSSQSKKDSNQCPGLNYFKRLSRFIENHFDIGEKYLEYIKSNCKENFCFCEDLFWIGPPCSKISKPYPNYETSGFHYMSIPETPTHIGGIEREVDDFQPWKQLTLFIKKNGFPTEEDVIEFANRYIADKALVIKHLDHLRYLY